MGVILGLALFTSADIFFLHPTIKSDCKNMVVKNELRSDGRRG